MSATPYPFEFLGRDALERRLDSPRAVRGDLGAEKTEWAALLDDIIAEETAFVHRVIVDEGVYASEFASRDEFLGHYPEVRRAMVRLCRSSIHEIESDGLSQESAEDRSEIYRAPAAVRGEVEDELSALDSPDSDAPDDFRTAVL